MMRRPWATTLLHTCGKLSTALTVTSHLLLATAVVAAVAVAAVVV